ncbi:MAG TPA: hypothetical protein VF316_23250 [Polyangiaceae bacterium]
MDGEIARTLRRAAQDASISKEDRFWAIDTLAFFALERESLDEVERHLRTMRALLPRDVPPRMAAAIDGKRMLVAGARKDWKKAEAIAGKALGRLQVDAEAHRIFRYNFARVLYKRGHYARAAKLTEDLALEYFDVLNLDPSDLVGKNPHEIPELLPPSWSADDVKHLADALDLFAHCRRPMGDPVGFSSLHASKLFVVASAIGSAVRVGLDAARDYAEGRHTGRPDPVGAVMLLEHVVLPFIAHERLVGHVLEARALYVDLLESVGRVDDARMERARLAPYVRALGDRPAK